MTLGELLRKKKDAIIQRWLDDVLASYSEDAAVLFKRQKDPFANPVGHSLRLGTRGIFEIILKGIDIEGRDDEKISQHLREMIKIRAVQQFSASQAVGFVFLLKKAVRAELGKAAADPKVASELVKFEAEVDRIALAGFEIFVECREQLSDLRVNEVKQRVSWILEKMSQHGLNPELVQLDLG